MEYPKRLLVLCAADEYITFAPHTRCFMVYLFVCYDNETGKNVFRVSEGASKRDKKKKLDQFTRNENVNISDIDDQRNKSRLKKNICKHIERETIRLHLNMIVCFQGDNILVFRNLLFFM